jgi:hypothetical protein
MTPRARHIAPIALTACIAGSLVVAPAAQARRAATASERQQMLIGALSSGFVATDYYHHFTFARAYVSSADRRYAAGRIHASHGSEQLEPALVVLRRTGTGWRVLDIGTGEQTGCSVVPRGVAADLRLTCSG